MGSMERWDAVVVGAGPNGLTAAATLARSGRSVMVLEAGATVGGGLRSGPLTEDGFVHDHCSAVHPLAAASPAFAGLPLADHGVELCYPEVEVAHPLDGGRAAVVTADLEATARQFGPAGRRYRRLLEPVVDRWDAVVEQLLGPLRPPRHPLAVLPFALRALPPATVVGRALGGDEAAAAWAGCAAHAIVPLGHPLTSAFGTLFLASAHAVRWPVVRGGSQVLADALAGIVEAAGGEVRTGVRVRRWADLPPHRAVLFDTDPGQLLAIAGHRLRWTYRRRLLRFRHGPGAFKLDYTLNEAVPWTHPDCRRAGTVHVGGTLAEVAAAEAEVAAGRHPERPFLIVAQQSVVDDRRAPPGRHTLWVYTHVPAASSVDMTPQVERQLERFAPGFRDVVRTRHAAGPADFERDNPNQVGGDIAGGSNSGLRMVARPVMARCPYTTSDPRILLCSASTPPGAGVHGMPGFHAARAALRRALA
jgi:phytoene dehydrogenase-like protein